MVQVLSLGIILSHCWGGRFYNRQDFPVSTDFCSQLTDPHNLSAFYQLQFIIPEISVIDSGHCCEMVCRFNEGLRICRAGYGCRKWRCPPGSTELCVCCVFVLLYCVLCYRI
ncbi:hypothetical protein BJ878DRAFT_522516 [Calycina marina]|uniref:Uncharacterized protein n=1 Tax=Calycina marina TaxID=1763456 RepID=A0A9P7YWG8_9HELO|nr:hypothetical protein BJ878DRAFT_522516 [Calycina marina]